MPFDTRQYEWADMTLVINGRDITGMRAVKYSEEIERETLYAKGRHAHSVQSGNVAIKGEIAVLQSEYEALVEAGNGSILNLKGLDGVISYGDPVNGDAITTDRLEGIYFTIAEKDIKQGDKFMEIKLPFIALRLKNRV